MKYQSLAIIFVLIMLPISIVLSYYVQSETDTLTLQTSYQTKLNDSTYDAIAAYQINSLNTQRVRGESVKSYVSASVNTFFTTMATNLGMSSASKSMILPYVPAILFTTYDGYYIYSPTYVSKVAVNPDNGVALLDSYNRILYLKKGQTITDSDLELKYGAVERTIKDSSIASKCTIDPKDANVQYETSYMLKPFIYYSAQYTNTNYDFIASYSLDNYMTVYGTKNSNRDTGTYVTNEFTKSGYLLDYNKIELSGSILVKLLAKNNSSAPYDAVSAPDILSGKEDVRRSNEEDPGPSNTTHNTVRYMAVDVSSTEAAYNYINYYSYDEATPRDGFEKRYYANKVSGSASIPVRTRTGDEIISDTLEINRLVEEDESYKTYLLFNEAQYQPIQVKYDGITIDDDEAKEYYLKAYFFSKWVEQNLKDVTASSVVQLKDAGNLEYYTDFSGDTSKIFDITNSENNPESDFSWFVNHKKEIIKNSIQYNLNLSISTYNQNHAISNEAIGYGLGYTLPVLSNADWDNILNNICMVSFMQGMPCGLTTFNSYSVVKSNNNNTYASLENMYFAQEIGKTKKSTNPYHKIDCKELGNHSADDGSIIYEGDQSAEFKYDAKKINTKIASITNQEIVCFFDSEENKYYKWNNIYPSGGATSDVSQLAVGDEITDPAKIIEYSELPLGNDVKYLYDHQNEGCYDCIISGSYQPAIKIYDGVLYRTYITADEEMIIDTGSVWIYANGIQYKNPITGSNTPAAGTDDKHGYLITPAEFAIRKKTIYTELARIKNSLYKTNSYLNR